MRLFIGFILIVFIFFDRTLAQTDIPDKAEVYGVWQADGSPYRINGEAIVPADSCLIIEPGVRIEFKTGSNHEYPNPAFDLGLLRIQGCLQVRGTADQPVVFTRQGDNGNWGLLFFDEDAADSSFVRFANVEYASYVQYLQNWKDYYGALSIANAAIAVENCRIVHNANDGLFIQQAPLTIKNCLIARNGQNGIRAISQSDLQITNITVADNGSAGLDCGVNSQPQIVNSIFSGNAPDFTLGNYAQISLEYSLMAGQDIPEGVLSQSGNFWGKDPKFVNPAADDYRLAANSFAVNSGTPDTSGLQLPSVDPDGNPRVQFSRVDMGAFERHDSYLRLTYPNGNEPFVIQTEETLRWQTDLSETELQFSEDNGQSWRTIATVQNQNHLIWQVPDIPSEQCLIRVLSAGNASVTDTSDTTFIIDNHAIIRSGLHVSGTWRKEMSPIEIRGSAIVPKDSLLTIEPGVRVALHAGTSFDFASPNFDAGFLWVQGNLKALGTPEDSIVFDVWQSGHWATLLLDGTDSLLSGLQYVRVRQAAGIDSVDGHNFPAAVSLHNTDCEISHARISDNAASGLLISAESAPTVHHCIIESNAGSGILAQNAQHFGKPEMFANRIESNRQHGIALKDLTAAYVHDNLIEHNDSTGIYLQTGYATVRIENNRIGYQPTGIYCDNTAPKLVGDVIYHSENGIVLDNGNADVGNVTLAKNTTAIRCVTANPVLTNTLFGYNTYDFRFPSGDNSAPTVSYCLTTQPYFPASVTDAGFNRTYANPKFVNSGPYPFSIQKGSAAIDHGTDENTLITLPPFDVAGHVRILDGNHDGIDQIDIGAYEFAELIADFKAQPLSGAVPLTVHFTDQTVGNVDSRQWDFGDGATSQETNPIHTFDHSGKFTVRLIVEGEAGRDTLTRTDYIYAKYPPYVCHPLSDTSFAEDAGWQFIKAMTTVFCDSDTTSALTFSLQQNTSKVQTRWQHDSLFVKSDSNFSGQDRIIVTAKDGIGLTVSDSFLIVFREINDPPFHSNPLPDSLVFASDSTVELNLWDFYEDVETPDAALIFRISVSNDSVFTAFDSTDGILRIFSNSDFQGEAELYIQVSDDSAAFLRDTVALKIFVPTALPDQASKSIPSSFFMSQAFPNPFNPTAAITYGLPVAQRSEIDLFDVLGRKIAVLFSGRQAAGIYTLQIRGDRLRLASGIYFVVLRGDRFTAKRKIVLLK